LIIEVNYGAYARTGSDCSASFVACAIEHVANADDKSARKLVIAADLAASGKAITV
jgi:hypothetical protein